MTYVDDMVVSGEKKYAEKIVEEIRKIWQTSEPEWISQKDLKFLGMEVKRQKKGEECQWIVSQESYVKDLLERQETVEKVRKIPLTRD